MNEEKKQLARGAGIVVVEHVIETTWSDDRAPYSYTVSHNATFRCKICLDVAQNMEAVAAAQVGGEAR